MKRVFSVLVTCALACSLFVGCTSKQDPNNTTNAPGNTTNVPNNTTNTPNNTTNPVGTTAPETELPASALNVLESIWAAWEFEYKDYFTGGGYANMVSGAPGAVETTDVDALQALLYVPEANLADVKGAASVMHGMNANVFTAAAFLVDDVAAFAATMKDTLMNTQWICGSPASMMVYTLGNEYVLFAFGDTENLDSFRAALSDVYADAASVFDGLMG